MRKETPASAVAFEGSREMSDTRQHAHQVIDRMPETDLSALVGLLETIVDSAFEDEEIGAEEA